MKIGSLCSGYGGLDMAVEQVYGGQLAWVSDIDKGACKILAHRYPNVPNLGDFTATDWATVEPVDILCAGFPCQPVSHAGKRLGDQDERWLWDDVLRAVRDLRPGLVVLENVRGLLTARGGRLFGRVLGSLADVGYDASWHGVKAADVGAPHNRFRVFVVATDTARGGRHETIEHDGRRAAAQDGPGVPHEPDRDVVRTGSHGALLPSPRTSDTNGAGHHGDGGMDLRTAVSLLPTPSAADGNGGGRYSSEGHQKTLPGEARLLPTPRAGDGEKGGPNQRGSSGDLMLPSAVHHLLPTPAVNDMGAGKTVEEWDAWTARMKAEHGNGNGHGASLSIEAQRLLPTPRASDGPDATSHGRTWSTTDRNLHNVAREQGWGQYAAAIHRWETLTRPAPPPTETGPKGNPRLSPAFSEWMMGLPAGWVTDVPNITRNEALKALGNGVVPQQAAEALRVMASWEVAA